MTTKKGGRIWTDGIDNVFAGQTMSNFDLRTSLKDVPEVEVLPDLWVLKMGGQSVIDRGRAAVYPILDEIVACRAAGHHVLIGTGGGTRARHVYAQALDLGMPTGMLAKLGGGIPVQNARMLQMLLASHGGIVVYPEDFEKLPLFLNLGCIPIMSGMPPNEFWEKSASVGRIPPNRTDAGVFLIAEFLGAKGVIFVKDEDGMYTDDPKKNPDATLIPEASAADLLASGQDDFIVERVVLDYLTRSRRIKEIRIVNGLKPGSLTAALNGEEVGSVIRA